MTDWLSKRLEWDLVTAQKIFDRMYPQEAARRSLRATDECLREHMQAAILEQFNKQSLLWKYFNGTSA